VLQCVAVCCKGVVVCCILKHCVAVCCSCSLSCIRAADGSGLGVDVVYLCVAM